MSHWSIVGITRINAVASYLHNACNISEIDVGDAYPLYRAWTEASGSPTEACRIKVCGLSLTTD